MMKAIEALELAEAFRLNILCAENLDQVIDFGARFTDEMAGEKGKDFFGRCLDIVASAYVEKINEFMSK